MFLIGLLSIVYWKRKAGVNMNLFFFGGLVWLIAISIKAVMDYTVSPEVYYLIEPLGIASFLLVSGLYLGLRTGLLESGLSYLAVLRSELKRMEWKEAVAFGIGFGAAEAMVLGIYSFLSIITFIIFPGSIQSLPVEYQVQIMSQLEMDTIVIFAPMMERVFTIMAHIFATVLVVAAVRSERIDYLILSILYKTLLDGIIPWISYNMVEGDMALIYIMEMPIVIIGLIGYFGMGWLKPRFARKRPRKRGHR